MGDYKWEPTVGRLPLGDYNWESTLGVYFGNLLWESTLGVYSGSLHSGSLLSRATDFGSGDAQSGSLLWESTLGVYTGTTDFGSESAHSGLWESTLGSGSLLWALGIYSGSLHLDNRFRIWICTYLYTLEI